MMERADFFEVTTEATSKDMTTVDQMKTELSITGVDAARDAKILTLIHQASADIVGYIGRDVAQETITATWRLAAANCLSAESVEALIIPRRPVVSITSVVEDGTTLTTDDWELDKQTGLLYRLDGDDERQDWLRAKIVVVFVAGYEMLPDLPDDLERACIELVKAMWFALERDPRVKAIDTPGVLSEQFWIGGVGESGNIPPDIAKRLDPYKEKAYR